MRRAILLLCLMSPLALAEDEWVNFDFKSDLEAGFPGLDEQDASFDEYEEPSHLDRRRQKVLDGFDAHVEGERSWLETSESMRRAAEDR